MEDQKLADEAQRVAEMAAKSPEEVLVDAGRVVLWMKDPNDKLVPIPLPELMNQIFVILRDHDERIPEKREEKLIVNPFEK